MEQVKDPGSVEPAADEHTPVTEDDICSVREIIIEEMAIDGICGVY